MKKLFKLSVGRRKGPSKEHAIIAQDLQEALIKTMGVIRGIEDDVTGIRLSPEIAELVQ